MFQAEDGIRDVAVTGVQTCALPIWHGMTNDDPRKVTSNVYAFRESGSCDLAGTVIDILGSEA